MPTLTPIGHKVLWAIAFDVVVYSNGHSRVTIGNENVTGICHILQHEGLILRRWAEFKYVLTDKGRKAL